MKNNHLKYNLGYNLMLYNSEVFHIIFKYLNNKNTKNLSHIKQYSIYIQTSSKIQNKKLSFYIIWKKKMLRKLKNKQINYLVQEKIIYY